MKKILILFVLGLFLAYVLFSGVKFDGEMVYKGIIGAIAIMPILVIYWVISSIKKGISEEIKRNREEKKKE